MKKVVALILALSMVMLFAVAFAETTTDEAANTEAVTAADDIATEEAAEETADADVVEEVVEEPVVATPTTVVPVEDVEIVAASDALSVNINGVDYYYMAFSEQAKWGTPTSPVFWGRIYKSEAYLFSMVTGQFVGKYSLVDLSYVTFDTEIYMNNVFVPLIKSY